MPKENNFSFNKTILHKTNSEKNTMITEESNKKFDDDRLKIIDLVQKMEDSTKENGQTFWDLIHKVSTYYNYINRLWISGIFITILIFLLFTQKFKFFFDITQSDLKLDSKETFFIQMFWITIIPFILVQCAKDIRKWYNNIKVNKRFSSKTKKFYRELLSYRPKDTAPLIKDLQSYANQPENHGTFFGKTQYFNYFFRDKKLILLPESHILLDKVNPSSLFRHILSYPEYIFIKELFGLNKANPFEFSFEDDSLIDAMKSDITFKPEQIKNIDVIIKELKKKYKIT